MPLIESSIERRQQSFSVEDKNIELDESLFIAKVHSIFGPLVKDETARTIFRYLAIESNDCNDNEELGEVDSRPRAIIDIEMTGFQWMKKVEKHTTLNPMLEKGSGNDDFNESHSQWISHAQASKGIAKLRYDIVAGTDHSGKTIRPTMLAVLQFLSNDCHEAILKEQKAAAAVIISAPTFGIRLKELGHSEVANGTGQKVALT